MTTYSHAADVEKIAHQLIRGPHVRLATAPIAYLFREPPAKDRGRDVWGKARKITGLPAYLATTPQPLEDPAILDLPEQTPGDFYVVEVALDIWAVLNERQRVALIDHELSHLDYLPGEPLALAAHDVEEFAGVVRRQGLWSIPLLDFVSFAAVELNSDIATLGGTGEQKPDDA